MDMKYLKNTVALTTFALLLSMSFSACGLIDDDSPITPGGGDPPSAGQWKVSYFFDKQEETGNYNGYTFEFGPNGELTATQGTQVWTGTWSTGFDDSKDKFLMDFAGAHPSALEELEEDWLIIEQTDSFMHFEHTSGGNGDTDVAQFTKS